MRFCLTAHYRQARTHLRRIEEIEELYARSLELAEANGLPDRVAGGLIEVALGFRLRNQSYRSIVESTAGEEISDLTASRDLKALVDSDLLQPVGERRGRYYVAVPKMLALREEIRARRPPRTHYDPFVLAQENLQLRLDA